MDYWQHPLDLLDNPTLFVAWVGEVGKDRASKELGDACRAHLEQHGIRSAAEIASKLMDASAQLEEYQ